MSGESGGGSTVANVEAASDDDTAAGSCSGVGGDCGGSVATAKAVGYLSLHSSVTNSDSSQSALSATLRLCTGSADVSEQTLPSATPTVVRARAQ